MCFIEILQLMFQINELKVMNGAGGGGGVVGKEDMEKFAD